MLFTNQIINMNYFTEITTRPRIDHNGKPYEEKGIFDKRTDLGALWKEFAARFNAQDTAGGADDRAWQERNIIKEQIERDGI